jgi:hypothetical protein
MRRSFANRAAWLPSFVMSLAIAPGLFAHPGSGIAVDRDGVVYFTDSLLGVCKVDKAGRVHLVGGSAFHWMTMDEHGAFADAPDSFGEWFERSTPRRSMPTLVTCSDFPCAVGSDGNLYYAKNHQFTITRRTPAGRESVLARHPRPEAWSVTGLARGPEGAIYAMAVEGEGEKESPCAVFRVSRGGKIETFASGFATEELPADQRHHEVGHWYGRGLCVDGDGSVYAAMTGSRCVMKFNRKGEQSVVLRSTMPWTPTGVAVHDGSLYVLEYDDETPVPGREWPPRIRKVARDGAVTTVAEVVRPPAARRPK